MDQRFLDIALLCANLKHLTWFDNFHTPWVGVVVRLRRIVTTLPHLTHLNIRLYGRGLVDKADYEMPDGPSNPVLSKLESLTINMRQVHRRRDQYLIDPSLSIAEALKGACEGVTHLSIALRELSHLTYNDYSTKTLLPFSFDGMSGWNLPKLRLLKSYCNNFPVELRSFSTEALESIRSLAILRIGAFDEAPVRHLPLSHRVHMAPSWNLTNTVHKICRF